MTEHLSFMHLLTHDKDMTKSLGSCEIHPEDNKGKKALTEVRGRRML